METTIRTEELTKRFGDRVAVDRIILEVRSGEIFGFLGPNGAGKTTTISMLLGLIRPTSGRAFVLGYDIQKETAAALREVGAMIEAPAFYPYLSGAIICASWRAPPVFPTVGWTRCWNRSI